MASTKFYLDTRGIKPGKTAALKLSITHKGKSALLSLNVHILPTQWDNLALKIVGHPNKAFLNMYICNRKQEVDNIILKLFGCGKMVSMSVADLKARIMNEIAPQSEEEGTPTLFAERFLRFAGTKKESTRGVYMQTYSRMRQYMGEDLDRLTFEDITKDWLVRFDLFLQKTAPKIALISAGIGNQWHFPHQDIISRLRQFQVDTLVTATVGQIRLRFTKQGNIEVETARTLLQPWFKQLL